MWKSLIRTVTPLAKTSCLLSAENSLQQQLRTTFVLKRRTAPPLSKKGLPPRKLKNRHYVYELVSHESNLKKPSLEVILTHYVDGLGNPGDKVTVKAEYAYDNLLLPGLAVYASPENLEKYKSVDLKDTVHYSSSTALTMMKDLSRITLSLIMNKDSPWTIQPWHIKASFRKCGYVVPDYAITVPETPIKGPDMNLEGKEFYITVSINKTEQVKVRCRIHHWSNDIKERLPYEDEFWKTPGELLFPQDEEIAKTQTN